MITGGAAPTGPRADSGGSGPRARPSFEALINQTADVIMTIDPDLRLTWVSGNVTELLGYSPDELVGVATLDLVHPDDIGTVADRLAAMLDEGFQRDPLLVRARHKDGSWHPIEGAASNLLDDEGVGALVVTMRDVAGRIERERERERLIKLVQGTTDVVVVIDAEFGLQWANQAATEFFGLDDGDRSTVRFLQLMSEPARSVLGEEILPALEESGHWSGEMEFVVEGERVPTSAVVTAEVDDEGDLREISIVARDIRERIAFEHELRHQATHDPLTGLPNRVLLADRLEVALARSARLATGVAVLFCDVDHFKRVNDRFGHRAGDRLLREVAERLTGLLRPFDTVGRLGGDEFVLVCTDLKTVGDAARIARRISRALQEPIVVDHDQVSITLSVGIAYSEGPLDDPEALVRDADAALYRAKQRGRARYELCDGELRSQVTDRLAVENDLRPALESGQLIAYYQPKIDLRTGRLVGIEALVRWNHPRRGLLAPDAFLDVAEESGLIVPLGRVVLHDACAQAMAWQRDHPEFGDLFVCVNMSARQISHPDVVRDVAAVLESTGMDPGHLDLEVTESVLLHDVERAVRRLDELKALGLKIVVDDFGTGYSSLTYLRRFPVDLLKVDRSFIAGLGVDGEDTTIVGAVVGLAHSLGLGVIAEGVETADQLRILRELGCDYAQGFFMARPMPAAGVDEILAANPVW
jgi:diguanylate cyclase (GGDEF)-like protein/PAS domain S-box-containing protein